MFNQNISLKNISYYKIGGRAKYFFKASNIDDIKKAVEMARALDERIFILGGGTNVLINDDGFDGLILKPNLQTVAFSDTLVRVGAGVLMDDLVNILTEEGFAGLEWVAGLPGTVGGAVRGNAGAFGGEIKDVVSRVVSLDISSGDLRIIERNAADCGFSYRSSIFKNQAVNKLQPKEMILEVVLSVKKGDKTAIREITERNINYRRSNHPLEYPSLGSTFKNIKIANLPEYKDSRIFANEFVMISDGKLPVKNDPFPVIPVAYLISECGLKGVSCGGAMISPKHPNFIVNILDATAKDVKNLIELAKDEVRKKFKLDLEEEIEYL